MANTRYVNWQLDLHHPQHSSRIDFAIEALWYNPEGRLFYRNTINSFVEPGWTYSYHNNGWGNIAGGAFQPGNYRVEFRVGGAKVATGNFQIVR